MAIPELATRRGIDLVASADDSLSDTPDREVTGVVYSGSHGTEIVDRDGMPTRASVGPLRAFASHWGGRETGDLAGGQGRTLTFPPQRRRSRSGPASRRDGHPTAGAGLRDRAGCRWCPPETARRSAILDRESAIRSAISVGDDRTDVTVWHMLDTLQAEGRLAGSLSVGVLSAETPPIVSESADTLIEGVAGTERFLAALVADLGRA